MKDELGLEKINLPSSNLVVPRRLFLDWDLKEYEKMLLSEILRLQMKTENKLKKDAERRKEDTSKIVGYAYAGNQYFSVVFQRSKSQIVKTLAKLQKRGYIKIWLSQNGTSRRIYIVKEKCL